MKKDKYFDVINEIKKHKLAKEIEYPATPIIYFESSHNCYVDNPIFKNLKIKNLPIFVSSQTKKYENWMEKNQAKVHSVAIINKIIQESLSIIRKYEPEVKELSKRNYKNACNLQIIKDLKLIDKILTDTYHRYVFYTGEHFDTHDEKLLKKLPRIRLKLSEFVDSVQKICAAILDELKSRFSDIMPKAFDFATSDEIMALLNGSAAQASFGKLINRPIAYISLKNNLVTLKGKQVFDIVKYLKRKDENKKIFNNASGCLEGNIAFAGVTKGEVIVISSDNYGNYSKVLKGKHNFILVAPMTRPEVVPYLQNAKAIITDEGGITCHAAIVSRELKIPCIIGTKIATKVLRDGDLVEVDANNGVVKIIQR